MNQPVNELIDPSLQKAIEQWKSYVSDTVQTEQVVLRLSTPLKDTLQITQQVMESMQANDWKAPTDPPDPKTLTDIACELSDIQVSAFGKIQENYSSYLETGVKGGTELVEALLIEASPQQRLAAWLDASLEVTKQYQEDTTQLVSDLSAIQAAYTAWRQKSLESLFG